MLFENNRTKMIRSLITMGKSLCCLWAVDTSFVVRQWKVKGREFCSVKLKVENVENFPRLDILRVFD